MRREGTSYDHGAGQQLRPFVRRLLHGQGRGHHRDADVVRPPPAASHPEHALARLRGRPADAPRQVSAEHFCAVEQAPKVKNHEHSSCPRISGFTSSGHTLSARRARAVSIGDLAGPEPAAAAGRRARGDAVDSHLRTTSAPRSTAIHVRAAHVTRLRVRPNLYMYYCI